MNKLLTMVLCFAAGALVLSAATSSPPLLAEEESGDAPALFEQHKCNLCHGVAAAGIEATSKSEKTRGDDLSGYQLGDRTFEEVATFLRKESEMDGETHKKGFTGTDEELRTILDWLGSLEAAE